MFRLFHVNYSFFGNAPKFPLLFQSFFCCLSVFSPPNPTRFISPDKLMYNQQFSLLVTIQDSLECLEHILTVSGLILPSTLAIFTISWSRHSFEAADSPASSRQCRKKVQYWWKYLLILVLHYTVLPRLLVRRKFPIINYHFHSLIFCKYYINVGFWHSFQLCLRPSIYLSYEGNGRKEQNISAL